MKKLYNIIGILAVIVFVFGFKYLTDVRTNPIDESVNYEKELFDTASLYELDSNEIDQIETISTSPVDEDTAQIYGYNYTYNIDYSNIYLDDMSFPGLPYNSELLKYNLDNLKYSKLSLAQNKKIASAKERIYKLIDDYSIFSDKDFLKECVKNVNFYLVKDSDFFSIPDTQDELVAQFYEGSIYVNKEKQDYFFEHTATHELIHLLRHLTHYGNTNWSADVPYAGMPFDEGMTEILTYSTNAHIPSNINGYKHYTPNIYRYLNLFKEDALKAYFYGYDEFFEKYGGETFKIEHEAFSASFIGYNTEFIDLMNYISIEILNKMSQDLDK
ncbi:MAG: hypothetical protein IJW20_04750 [Clostridia bacterium]|nr:hypothetical protein [Clostridia bacterium]